jgi:hypothetical protein
MFLNTNRLLFFIAFSFFSLTAFAQTGRTPYSMLGIGIMPGNAFIHNMGMGGLGVSHSTAWHLNNLNPALLTQNQYSVFDVGVFGDYRRLETNTLSQRNGGANIGYLAFGIPVIQKKWTLSAGYQPFSSVNYRVNNSTAMPGQDGVNLLNAAQGSGGISQAFIANGFKVNENFSVGLRAMFLFGSIAHESIIQVDDQTTTAFPSAYVERDTYSDFAFQLGLNYRMPLGEKDFLSMGLITDVPKYIGGTRSVSLEQRSSMEGETVTSNILVDQESDRMFLPLKVGTGLSYHKANRWSVGTDVHFQNWRNFRPMGASQGDLANSLSVILGGEITPDMSSVDNYLKRITYRAGLNFEQTPFVVNNEQIQDFGINFGMSFPVSRGSSLNLGLGLGQRGTLQNDLIREQYIKVAFGVTFNDRPWIKLPKYD